MSKKKLQPRNCEGKRAGFVYLATNPAMPGLVKAGRTQDWPYNRVKGLYSTGVPEPFVCLDSKFFVDCYTAEGAVREALAKAGSRCNNREFFKVGEKTARTILANHYRIQDELVDLCGNFEQEALEAFRLAVAEKQLGKPELIVDSLSCLPYRRRAPLLLDVLATSLALEAEYYAMWLVGSRGVDPETPIDLGDHRKGIDLYHLTGYENSVVLHLVKLEKHLGEMGCNLIQSNALCWIIDSLINDDNRNEESKCKLVRYGIDLLKKGADVQKVLEVGLFAEAPRRRHGTFRYDLFPRNSRKTCYDVIGMLAPSDKHFAELRYAVNVI